MPVHACASGSAAVSVSLNLRVSGGVNTIVGVSIIVKMIVYSSP